MLYAVLVTGRPGETGVRDRFFQAHKQAQSFLLGSRILRGPFSETASSNSDWRLAAATSRLTSIDRIASGSSAPVWGLGVPSSNLGAPTSKIKNLAAI